MSKMADLHVEIEEMLFKGTHPSTISAVLEVPVTWVYEVSDSVDNTDLEIYNPFKTINS